MSDTLVAGLTGVGIAGLQIAAERQNLSSEKIALAMAAVGVGGSMLTKKNKTLSHALAAAGIGFAATSGFRYYEQMQAEKSMSGFGMGAVVTPIGQRRSMGAIGPKNVHMNAVVTPVGRRNPATVTMNGWGV